MSYVDDGDLSYGLDCPMGESPLPQTEGEWQQVSEETGFALEHLRILTGPICEPCHDTDGEIIPATVEDDHHGFAAPTWLCESCANREPGDQGEDDGPSGPSDQDRFEARRDSGRRA